MSVTYEEETFTVTSQQKSAMIVCCDVCKKLIYKKSLMPDSFNVNKKQITFWHLQTGHNDWGNDSCDSVESFYLCSPECAKVKFCEYVDDSKGGWNSMYFEIEHEREFCFEFGDHLTPL